MKTTRTAWMLLIAAGAIFASCRNNNEKQVAQNMDTASLTPVTASTDISSANPDAGTGSATASTTTTTDATNNAAVINTNHPLADDNYVCVRKPLHKMAYKTTTTRRWKKHISQKTSVEPSESTVASAPVTPEQPAPAPEASAPIPSTPSAPVTFEKQSEYSGNMQQPKKRSAVHLAPEAGGNINNLYMLSDGYQTSNELKVGFNAGVMVNVDMSKRISFQPGVRYIMKGGELTSTSVDGGGVTTEHKEKLTFHYVEVPVNFVYNSGDWGTNRFMIGAGPYFALLANAQDKVKDKMNILGEAPVVNEGQHSLPVGDPDNIGTVRSFDAGANAFIGYQMRSGVYVKAGAEVGLLDLEKHVNTLNGFYDRNYNFLLTVGYMCGYNK